MTQLRIWHSQLARRQTSESNGSSKGDNILDLTTEQRNQSQRQLEIVAIAQSRNRTNIIADPP